MMRKQLIQRLTKAARAGVALGVLGLVLTPLSSVAKQPTDRGNGKHNSGVEVIYEQTGLAYDSTTLVLSEMSNNEGELDGVLADELNATAIVTVADTTLTIELMNTSDPLSTMDFDISAFNFNHSFEVSNVQLTSFPSSDAGWLKSDRRSDLRVGGFGRFDVAVKAKPDLTFGEVGLNPDLVNAGETGLFVFSFACSGTCDAADFDVEIESGKAVAVKFINGDGIGGLSAWGASGAGH